MSIPDYFFSKAHELDNKDALIFKEKDSASWEKISWRHFSDKVRCLSNYLIKHSVNKGDRVALLSENRPEWPIADLAILSAGGVTVPLYFTSTSSQIEHILSDSGAGIIIVSTTQQLAKVMDARSSSGLREIIIMDGVASPTDEKVTSLHDIFSISSDMDENVISERLAGIADEDLASILYTSGTTGPPKGVMLTHGNFISNAKSCIEVIHVSSEDTLLSFLPLSHAFERTAGYYAPLFAGASIAYAESIENIPQNIKGIKPTIVIGVPRFYEKTFAAINEKVAHASTLKKAIFHWAFKTGAICSQKKSKRKSLSAILKLQLLVAEKLVFSKLKSGLGGNLRFFVSGGAPLSTEISGFFESAGLIILAGYGLTETSPVISCNTLKFRKAGSVGLPLPDVEISIADDGEIITKGPNLMKGYFNNSKLTDEVIRDGWFHTGDIGEIDGKGFLTITDRKKDIIVTSGGKNIAPQSIEMALVGDTLINQTMVYGDQKKYIVALIVPDFERLKSMKGMEHIKGDANDAICKDEEVIKFYLKRIEKDLVNFAPFERIKNIALLPEEFSMDKGEITPTLKVNRKVLTKKHLKLLEGLYENKKEFQI